MSSSTYFLYSTHDHGAIRYLQHERATDHTRLQGDHFVYVVDTFAPFLANLFNQSIVERIPSGVNDAYLGSREPQDYYDWSYVGQTIWGNPRGRVAYLCSRAGLRADGKALFR